MGIIIQEKTIKQILEEASVGFARPPARQIIAGAVVRGGAPLRDVKFRGRNVSVAPGADIQRAIDTVSNAGGGTVILEQGTHLPLAHINGADGVSIIGEGRDQTMIDFAGGAFGMRYIGTSSVILKNFEIENLTVQNSNHTAGIDVDFCDFWKIENVRITSCDQDGVLIDHSSGYIVTNCKSDANSGIGFIAKDSATARHTDFLFLNCISDGNSSNGIDIDGDFGSINGCRSDNNGGIGYKLSNSNSSAISNCTAQDNTGDGFDCAANYLRLNGCYSYSNGGKGFDFYGTYSVVVGNIALSNTGDGFEMSGTANVITGNFSNNNGGFEYQLSGQSLVVVGNGGWSTDSSTEKPGEEIILSDSRELNAFGNFWDSTRTIRRDLRMKNSSGGTLVTGDVVILKSISNGDEITTTTIGGDNKVFGVVSESITNGQYGYIRVEGDISTLRVDGTTDIAVGDLLGTFTAAKIAMKAAAGDMVFAMALEAYATDDSLGVLTVLLIKPRLI